MHGRKKITEIQRPFTKLKITIMKSSVAILLKRSDLENRVPQIKRSTHALMVGAGLLGLLAGCVTRVEPEPPRAYYQEEPPPVAYAPPPRDPSPPRPEYAPPPPRAEYAPPPPRGEYAPPPPGGERRPPPPRGEYSQPPVRGEYAQPPVRGEYAPPPGRPEGGPGVRDDYVYYPGYEVYYNSNRRQYTYREGNAWVSRPAPPRVAVDVLLASPAVRLDFHDAPQAHHEAIVRQYPKHWAPPGQPHEGAPRREGRADRE